MDFDFLEELAKELEQEMLDDKNKKEKIDIDKFCIPDDIVGDDDDDELCTSDDVDELMIKLTETSKHQVDKDTGYIEPKKLIIKENKKMESTNNDMSGDKNQLNILREKLLNSKKNKMIVHGKIVSRSTGKSGKGTPFVKFEYKLDKIIQDDGVEVSLVGRGDQCERESTKHYISEKTASMIKDDMLLLGLSGDNYKDLLSPSLIGKEIHLKYYKKTEVINSYEKVTVEVVLYRPEAQITDDEMMVILDALNDVKV